MIWLAAFLLVLVAVVQLRASSRERQAERHYPPQGRVLDIEGTPVHVLVAGAGPDLVLIHGANGNLRDWTYDFVDRLSDRYRVIMFDRPGLGWTGRLPGSAGPWTTRAESPMAQAELLQKAAAVIGVDQPVVVGHSFGGAVAMAWALSQPRNTAGIVMLSGVSHPWTGDLGWIYRVMASRLGGAVLAPTAAAFVPKSYVDQTINSIFAPQSPPQGYGAHLGAALALRRESLRANARQVNFLLPHIAQMSGHYATLNMPIEILHGTHDTIVPAAIHAGPLSKQVDTAMLTLLDGVGHMPHHTHPEAVVAAIDRTSERAGLRSLA